MGGGVINSPHMCKMVSLKIDTPGLNCSRLQQLMIETWLWIVLLTETSRVAG